MLRLRFQNGALTLPAPRASSPEIEYELHLQNVPRNTVLALSCEWRSADGAVRYHNRWETKSITHDPWATHCRHRFGAHDRAGAWTVEMASAERPLGSAPFVLE